MTMPQPEKQVLSTYPESVLRRANLIDANGEPLSASVVKSCKGDTCAYYRYLQGTSMASPHAAGVAALAVSRFGEKRRGEFGLNPRVTEFVLRRTATDTACPEPRTYVYQGFPPPTTAPHTWDATCEGPRENNGFYGDGIVDAERVASLGHDHDSDSD